MSESLLLAPNVHAIAMILVTVFALYLFTRDNIPLELSSLGLVAGLAVGFAIFPFTTVDPTDFFLGFAHEALIAVCALMVLGQGLVRTGALEPVGRTLARFWGRLPVISLLATLIVAAVLSAFVNNTPIVVLLLPILVSVCLRTSSSPAAVLMPMGFATLVGGMTTTIGTSTNLLVVSVANDLGLARIGMFDFVYPASIAAGVAILYLWLVAPRLLPDREIELESASVRLFDARLHVDEHSPWIGKTLAEVRAATEGEINVLRIGRGETFLMPLPDVSIRAGDSLRVRDTPANLKAFEKALGTPLYSGEQVVDENHPLSADNQMLAEIAVVQGSPLDRANLKYTRFLDRYQLAVLALHRAGKDIWRPNEDIQEVVLQPADILLVQGSRDHIADLKRTTEFLVLDASIELPSTNKAPMALGILIAVIVLSATGMIPIAISAVAGATLLVITGCLEFGAAMRAVRPSVYFVVVASLALGQGLVATGATEMITSGFLLATSGLSATVILSALMLLFAILTNIVSNNATAVIGTPIAVSIANQLGLPAEPFVLAILFGANMSYATPMAYQTNLLVMSAGNYTFREFIKVGVPLTVLMWLTLTWVLSSLYL